MLDVTSETVRDECEWGQLALGNQNNCYPPLNAKYPLDPTQVWDIYLTSEKVKDTSANPLLYYWLLHLVPEVVQQPKEIWIGLRECPSGEDFRLRYKDDQEFDCWICYIGKPDFTYNEDGQKVEPPKDCVFGVHLNDRRRIFAWEWIPQAEGSPFSPEGHQTRFTRGRVYKSWE